MPAVILIRELLEGETRPGDLVVLALVLFACCRRQGLDPAGAGRRAGAVLPLEPDRRRGLLRPVLALWRHRILALVGSYALIYSGGANGGSTIDPLRSAIESFPGSLFAGLSERGALGALLAYPAATAVTLLGLMPALAGLAWVVRRGRPVTPTQAWLLSLLATAVAAYLLLDLPGGSQLYFLWFGFAAGTFASIGRAP